MSIVFSRYSGRTMKELKYDGRGADAICENASVLVTPHPKGKDFKTLQSYEKTRRFYWAESQIYRPGLSPDLDLLEYANWMRFYPENLNLIKEVRS